MKKLQTLLKIVLVFVIVQQGYGQNAPDYYSYLAEIRQFNGNLANFTLDISTKKLLDKARSSPPPVKLVLQPVNRNITISSGSIRLRIFKPDTINGIVVDFHGGGWCIGNPESNDNKNDVTARASKVAVISVDYRLAPENPIPSQIKDCTEAVLWILKNAKSEFGTEKIILQGESAGAYLAASVTLKLKENNLLDNKIVGLNLIYGCYDLSKTPSLSQATEKLLILKKSAVDQFWKYSILPLKEDLRSPSISPLYADLTNLPQALFSVGTADVLIDDTNFMASRWRTAGNKATINIYPECTHIFDVFPTKIAQIAHNNMNTWIADCVK